MTIQEWATKRATILAEDEASIPFMRGYLDHANGREENTELFVGDPFGADDYYHGRQLASYEIGPVSVIKADGSVLSWVA